MPTNVKSFNKLILEYAREHVPGLIREFHFRVSAEVFIRVILKTPVDTGRARGNWQLSISRPIEDKTDQIDKGGGAAIAVGLSTLEELRPFETVWIVNNVEYILPLEHGHSKQAPGGMLSVTLAELKGIFG